ncbi:hemolysin III family protein [Flagellimonas sp. HMM57]|uniref:PAQR family membrane homeostasis protein TrhA n=1 Tax=unclassified Flagellimonas TaxID=2644544 RepID=UPI0013D46BF5|nr:MULTISPECIES: hemolysin III family protein [unclassified Flagellimonas]UII76402.1 hemolysin III family protein [Flagellimonas sp. HMM57]
MALNPKSVVIEEKWNCYSHALGVILTLIGFVFFLQKDLTELPYLFGSIIVYSISLILLFTASTMYHGVLNPKLKKKLRILDHISIYYLIAGTYTPACLTILSDSKGWLLFYLVWGIALFGTVLKLFFTGRFEVFSLVLYGIMGWLIVIDLPFLLEHVTRLQLTYLALGGTFYTIGIIFYTIKKIPYNHLIWHFFVLGGAISHWFMIYGIV